MKKIVSLSRATIGVCAILFFLNNSKTQQIHPLNTTVSDMSLYEPSNDPQVVPSEDLTPFLPNPAITQAAAGDLSHAILTTEATVVSKPGYAGSVRHVPGSIKHKVYLEYGILSHKSGDYEVDHLISLELGGSNDISNLWPQSYHKHWNAHMKDELEFKLHSMVSKGQLDLPTAQKEIALNWIAAYHKYIGDGEKSQYWND